MESKSKEETQIKISENPPRLFPLTPQSKKRTAKQQKRSMIKPRRRKKPSTQNEYNRTKNLFNELVLTVGAKRRFKKPRSSLKKSKLKNRRGMKLKDLKIFNSYTNREHVQNSVSVELPYKTPNPRLCSVPRRTYVFDQKHKSMEKSNRNVKVVEAKNKKNEMKFFGSHGSKTQIHYKKDGVLRKIKVPKIMFSPNSRELYEVDKIREEKKKGIWVPTGSGNKLRLPFKVKNSKENFRPWVEKYSKRSKISKSSSESRRDRSRIMNPSSQKKERNPIENVKKVTKRIAQLKLFQDILEEKRAERKKKKLEETLNKLHLPQDLKSANYYIADLRNFYFTGSNSIQANVIREHFQESFEAARNQFLYEPVNDKELKEKKFLLSVKEEDNEDPRVLFVDLDGTLISSETALDGKGKNTVQVEEPGGEIIYVKKYFLNFKFSF